MVFFVILDLQYLCIAHKLISSLALWQLLNLLDQDLTVDIEKCDPKSEFLLRYCILHVSCNMYNLRFCVCVCVHLCLWLQIVELITARHCQTSTQFVCFLFFFSFFFFYNQLLAIIHLGVSIVLGERERNLFLWQLQAEMIKQNLLSTNSSLKRVKYK